MAATVKASTEGLERVDRARKIKGWAKTEEAWADLACTSEATLKRFWAGVSIQSSAFESICQAVGIDDWESIIDFKEGDKPQLKMSSRRLSFAIAGSIEKIDKEKLDAIVKLLRQLGGDATIAILDVDEGSIRLILGGSEEALKRIEALFKAGELTQVEEIEILDAHFLEEEELASLIQKNGGTALNLRSADLRSVDLSSADLRGADLRGADLCGADLRGVDLSSADLRGADLSSANLRSVDLRFVHLSSANLRFADLSGANLRTGDLRFADLGGANLRSVDLRFADLSDTNLRGANVEGSVMTGSIGLSPTSIADLKNRGAIFNDSPGDRESSYSRDPVIPR